jgi:hypothetical protein
VSGQKPVDHFTLIPRRFTDAHIADELDAVHVLIGLHIAARCYEVLNTSNGVAPIRLSWLAELCEVSEETVRRKLHELRDGGWLDFEAPAPGQRSAWRIWQIGLAHDEAGTSRAPQTYHRPTTETPLSLWSSSSTDAPPEEHAIPHGERERTSTRAPQDALPKTDKRNEYENDQSQKQTLDEEKLDHVEGEATPRTREPELEEALRPDQLEENPFPPSEGCERAEPLFDASIGTASLDEIRPAHEEGRL